MHPAESSTGRSDDGLVPGPTAVPAHTWYARSALAVARDLLGAFVTTRSDEGRVTVRLTEVEAYGGEDDPGSHAYRGRTGRNAAMFGEPGRLYVYRHLGLHHCVNVVTEVTGRASAVLLRAGEVVEGADLAWARRERAGVVDSVRQLARGPARLAVALGLDLEANGADLTEIDGRVHVRRRDPRTIQPPVATGPRVGVSGAGGDGALHPWRLWLTGERTVSAYRPAYRSPTSADAPGATTSA
ncbi:DNA-3-methyladenine glycosylase [Cellulomonas xiejunii]|uniref:Putative 3-methyladenine DNA glycosylase n=1 Tax=Cellulomonas xiejunii TaxID=2968083 RepID=A0ABY5KSD0_9CELL|nr:DNA-3-methyladenine glycosylase [Cellulomonas xiejunii]MCC2316192.1 DNA-3-methyladenine glycosylase [Cellulomonas xiejunii]MCC2322109.1 DNA-3-methyladenine glycosylase [Cellulomonas xiejunii]UUI73396.1 DNA-3-methyladenine glycosylase [Cellulomonas xiejunii]